MKCIFRLYDLLTLGLQYSYWFFECHYIWAFIWQVLQRFGKLLFIYCFKLRILLTCKNVFGTHNDIHVLIWICRVAHTLQNIAAKGREILPLAPNKYLKSSWTCMSVKPVFNTRLTLYWKRATKPFLLLGMGQTMF